MKALVIYPYGPLVDLIERGGWRESKVYAVEFQGGVVKVGRSKNVPERIRAIVKDGTTLGLMPTRFFVSEQFTNVGRIERAVLMDLRASHRLLPTPEDFPASSEWFAGVDFEHVLMLVSEWVAAPNVERPTAVRVADLADMERAEATYAPTPVESASA